MASSTSTITADDLTAPLRRRVGGTFTDTFTITHGHPAAQLPSDGRLHVVLTGNLTAQLRRTRLQRPRRHGRVVLVELRRRHDASGAGAQPSHTYAAPGMYHGDAHGHRRRRRLRHGDPAGHRHRAAARPGGLRRRHLRSDRERRLGIGRDRRAVDDDRHARRTTRSTAARARSRSRRPVAPGRSTLVPPPGPTPTCGSPCRWTGCPPGTAPISTWSDAGSAPTTSTGRGWSCPQLAGSPSS